MKIDFHSHILPGIDDGAGDADESLKLLRMLKRDGVEVVVATPHLYLHRQSLSRFLGERKESVEILFEAIEKSGEKLPRVIIGAEVYFTAGIESIPLDELCIENTDYLLLELPYSHFTSTFMNSFANFINSCDVNIILAHIERYYEYISHQSVDEIVSYGLLAQGNCESLLSLRSRSRALKFINEGIISLLGTDLHRVDYRPPSFHEAENIIRKKLSDKAFDTLMQNARDILFST